MEISAPEVVPDSASDEPAFWAEFVAGAACKCQLP